MADTQRSPLIIGITGGIACGKSEAGRILEKMGFDVCDADGVAHELMKKGTPVFQQVVDHFGSEILAGNGEISRPALGKIVFETPAQRERLNRLVHPAVGKVLAGWIAERRRDSKHAAVLIPLLFESGMDALDWDGIVCISCGDELVLRRLEKRGLNRTEAEGRMRAQMPLKEKERRADCTVQNRGTLKEFEQALRGAVEALAGER